MGLKRENEGRINLESNDSFVLWPAQEDYVAVMKDVIGAKGVGIFQAGTGFGKTIANLMAAFESEQKVKVFYFSRTHQQAFQVVKEARRLTQDLGCRAVHLAARNRLCHIPEIYLSPWETQLCKSQQDIWKKGGITRYSATACHSFFAKKKGKRQVSEWQAQSAGIPSSATLKDLSQFAKKNRCCAYLTARDLATVRPLVVGSYMYGLDSQIRAALSISLGGSLVILDEGHNLEEVCCAILSLEITSNDLIESIETLERLRRPFMLQNEKTASLDLIQNLIEHINGLSSQLKAFIDTLAFEKTTEGETAFAKGHQLTDFFQQRGFDKELGREFFSFLNELEKPYKDDPDRLQQFTSLHKLGDFLLAFQKPIGFCVIIRKTGSAERALRVRWECLDPGLVLTEVNKEAKALIICSGTLEPLELTARIFGLENAVCKNFGSIIESENILVFAMGKDPKGDRLSSEYKLRKSLGTYQAYARAIEQVASFLKGGILCFFPSYDFLNNVVERGFRSSTLETVFVEERSSHANEEELRSFQRAVQTKSSAIFCAVIGGKVAEGTDLPQELSRGVVVCGIPFLPTKDPLVRLRRDYYNEKSSKLGDAWYLRESIRRAAQALGRGWRGKTDYAVGFLLDSRYLHRRNRQYIPARFRDRIHVLPSWDEVKININQFLSRIQRT